jgi:hypothetical protein
MASGEQPNQQAVHHIPLSYHNPFHLLHQCLQRAARFANHLLNGCYVSAHG